MVSRKIENRFFTAMNRNVSLDGMCSSFELFSKQNYPRKIILVLAKKAFSRSFGSSLYIEMCICQWRFGERGKWGKQVLARKNCNFCLTTTTTKTSIIFQLQILHFIKYDSNFAFIYCCSRIRKHGEKIKFWGDILRFSLKTVCYKNKFHEWYLCRTKALSETTIDLYRVKGSWSAAENFIFKCKLDKFFFTFFLPSDGWRVVRDLCWCFGLLRQQNNFISIAFVIQASTFNCWNLITS